MATWFEIIFTGQPTEADFKRVSGLAAQGYTSGQLINDPGAEDEEGPATGYYSDGDLDPHGKPWATAEEIDAARPATEWNPADSVVCTVRGCPGYGTPHSPLRITQEAHSK